MNANTNKSRKIELFVRLYQIMLGCFPERYRGEYAEELLYAVRMAAADAQAQGPGALLRLIWRELRDLPLAIARAYLNERSDPMSIRPGAHLPGGPIRLWQLAATFLPFLLPLMYHLLTMVVPPSSSLRIGPWLVAAVGLPFLAGLVVIFVTGLVRQFPVWTLPALGVLLFCISVILQFVAQVVVIILVSYPFLGRFGWPQNLPLAENIAIALLVQFVYLPLMIGVVTGLLRIVPAFYEQVQQEWTLLSFFLYGFAILPILGNDEFHGVAGYQTASLVILIVGAGLYLVAPRRWQRVLALLLPAILSPAVMSLGLYQVFPAQQWANPADLSFRLWEALQPVLYLAALPVLLLLASLAPRLPWGGRQERISPPSPNSPVQEKQ